MAALWRLFFDICCFRKGPQDVPASHELLILSLVAYAVGSFLLALTTQTVAVALFSGVIDMGMLAGLCYLLLVLWRYPDRWLQATTALSGTGLIFSIAAIPLSVLLAGMSRNDPMTLVIFLFVISLLVWNIGVIAHIMKHALSSSFALGVLAALFYIWVITAAITTLFPQSAGT